jgi:hypothetical protein
MPYIRDEADLAERKSDFSPGKEMKVQTHPQLTYFPGYQILRPHCIYLFAFLAMPFMGQFEHPLQF